MDQKVKIIGSLVILIASEPSCDKGFIDLSRLGLKDRCGGHPELRYANGFPEAEPTYMKAVALVSGTLPSGTSSRLGGIYL